VRVERELGWAARVPEQLDRVELEREGVPDDVVTANPVPNAVNQS